MEDEQDPDKAGFLGDDRQDEVGAGRGQISEFLKAHPIPDPKPPAPDEGDQAVDQLVAGAVFIKEGIEGILEAADLVGFKET